MKVAILGAGRMGQTMVRAIEAADDVELAGIWARSGGGSRVSADLDAVLRAADVAVDFTLPAATAQVLEAVARQAKPLVCGVTGLDDDLMQQLEATSRSIPLLHDRNMSLGIAVLTDLVARAAANLGPRFAASIHETHHTNKKDAPSGTALQLGEALARARRQNFRSVYRYAADDPAPRRTAADIVITAERRGEVAGEHRVCLASGLETLTLGHSVTDRRVFADGALLAAKWLVHRGAGRYAMRDVVAAGGADGGDDGRVTVK